MPTAFLLPGWGTPTERLQPLRDALRATGVDARAWPYETVGSIDLIGQQLATAVRHHDEVHLVGHSLGGLVAASAVLDHGAEVASVTTLNSPWRGTWAAWTAHPHDPLGHELRWGADALQRLRDRLAEHLDHAHGPRWTVVSAAGDLAAPATTALRVPEGPRLTKRLLPVSGHSVSLLHPRFVETVTEAVAGVPA